MLYEYNGIVMQMVKTNNIQFDAVFTEDGASYIYTHWQIDIQAVVNPQTMAYLGGDGAGNPEVTPGTFPALTIRSIRHSLTQQRKQLYIRDEAQNVLLKSPASGFTVDAKTGPNPISCSLINISGARTVLIRWQCEGWIKECPNAEDISDPADNPAPYILSNRWTDKAVINEYQLTTRVFSGRTVFNKAYLEDASLQPDDFRGSGLFPETDSRFQRKQVDISQSADGTELVWQVTDIERIWVLKDTITGLDEEIGPPGPDSPSGILEVDGAQTMVGYKPDANSMALSAQSINTIVLRAKGGYFSNQWVMIQRLLEIVMTLTPDLMNQPGATVATGYRLLNASVSRSLGQHEKWVQLEISIMCPAPELNSPFFGNVNIFPITNDIWHAINTTIYQVDDEGKESSPPLIFDDGTRGSAWVVLLSKELTDSCTATDELPMVRMSTRKQRAAHKLGAEAGGPESGSTLGQPPDDLGEIPQEDGTFTEQIPLMYDIATIGAYPYTNYKIELDIMNNTGIKQLPITGPITGDPEEPTCGIVQVHLPLTRFRYRGTSERVGAFPLMPSPIPQDVDNYVLLSWDISPFYAVPSFDGVTPAYRCDFEFEYAKITGLNPEDPVIPLGKLPFSLFGFEQRTRDDFSEDILGI